ncbi:hypothetical protein J6590_033684 [Homalodisca vitripennis]|nr:hypothetical protein J6590_033684 [Homalodisca vitripennis]
MRGTRPVQESGVVYLREERRGETSVLEPLVIDEYTVRPTRSPGITQSKHVNSTLSSIRYVNVNVLPTGQIYNTGAPDVSLQLDSAAVSLAQGVLSLNQITEYRRSVQAHRQAKTSHWPTLYFCRALTIRSAQRSPAVNSCMSDYTADYLPRHR